MMIFSDIDCYDFPDVIPIRNPGNTSYYSPDIREMYLNWPLASRLMIKDSNGKSFIYPLRKSLVISQLQFLVLSINTFEFYAYTGVSIKLKSRSFCSIHMYHEN